MSSGPEKIANVAETLRARGNELRPVIVNVLWRCFDESFSVAAAARRCGVSYATAKKYYGQWQQARSLVTGQEERSTETKT